MTKIEHRILMYPSLSFPRREHLPKPRRIIRVRKSALARCFYCIYRPIRILPMTLTNVPFPVQNHRLCVVVMSPLIWSLLPSFSLLFLILTLLRRASELFRLPFLVFPLDFVQVMCFGQKTTAAMSCPLLCSRLGGTGVRLSWHWACYL